MQIELVYLWMWQPQRWSDRIPSLPSPLQTLPHWSLSWMQRIQGVSCQFPPTSLGLNKCFHWLRHVVTLTLKHCAHLCWATKRMTCVPWEDRRGKGGRRWWKERAHGIKALGERSKMCSFHWILHLPACSGVIHQPVFSSADRRLKQGWGLAAALGALRLRSQAKLITWSFWITGRG